MIKWSGLAFYRKDKLILDSISGQLEQGELVLLSGPNGVGKTTLLNLIGGVFKDDTGSISINGQPHAYYKIKELAKVISILPQSRSFTLGFKVIDLLTLLPENRRSLKTEQIIQALDLVAILQNSILELSIGQQQRVSLAITLIQEADFYLLDEPFSAQDSQSVKRIVTLLKEVSIDKGVLVVSHNTDHLHANFDREIKLA
jgi:ABC-type Mn2+/Zn2+ transport system ATPase subunit